MSETASLAQIETLIDKTDTVELLRDEIGAILLVEQANQQHLARCDGKDPDDWKLRVYVERSNPWAEFQTQPEDRSPIVNVTVNATSYDEGQSDVVQRQHTVGVYHLDCYAYGEATETSEGHDPADEMAGIEAMRAARLVRNILMSSHYTYMGPAWRGIVGKRWPLGINMLQPEFDAQQVQHVVVARFAFSVEFNEFSPQYVPRLLEMVNVKTKRQSDGKLLLEAEYDYT